MTPQSGDIFYDTSRNEWMVSVADGEFASMREVSEEGEFHLRMDDLNALEPVGERDPLEEYLWALAFEDEDEDPTWDVSQLSNHFLNLLNSPSGKQKLAQAGGAYIRSMLRESSFAHQILPAENPEDPQYKARNLMDRLIKFEEVRPPPFEELLKWSWKPKIPPFKILDMKVEGDAIKISIAVYPVINNVDVELVI